MKNTNTIFSIQQFDRYMQEENLLTFRSKFRGGIALLFADDSLASILIYLMCLKTHVPDEPKSEMYYIDEVDLRDFNEDEMIEYGDEDDEE